MRSVMAAPSLPARVVAPDRRYRDRVTEPRRRSRLPLVLGAIAVVILVWAVAVAIQVSSMTTSVTDGVAHVDEARAGTDDLMSLVGAVSAPGDGPGQEDQVVDAAAQLDEAVVNFTAALDTAEGAVLAPVRVLPVLGRQLRTTTTLLRSAVEVGTDTSTAIGDLRDIAGRPAETPQDRLAAVRASQQVLDDLGAALSDPDLGRGTALIGPVRDARDRFARQVEQTRATVESASISLAGVGQLLEGPSTYLVLAANNAEMRSGSGMFLQVGTVGITDGSFQLSDFVPAQDLFLDQPGSTLDPDMAARWGSLVPDQEWRNLNLSPRFDESARMAADMWAASGRGAVDGVMSIDVVAVQRLLELTGPVEVPTEDGPVTFDADNVRKKLLREQYRQFDDRGDRRDQLGVVASAVFDAFNQRPIPAADLVGLIDRNGAERHLMLWSNDPTQEAAWTELGVSGVLPDDALMVSLVNRGGTKLDPYMELDATLEATDVGDHRRVTVTVELDNTAPEFLPRYVEGPYDGIDAVAGEYIGIVSLTVPKAATNPETSTDGFAVVGDDGPTRVIGGNIAVPRGERRQVTISFDLPSDWETVSVTSAARVPATRWTAGTRTWTERRPRTVTLDSLE